MMRINPRLFFGQWKFQSILFWLIFLLAFLVNLQDAQATWISDSMLGYWKFDGNLTDWSGDGSTANLTGTTAPNYATSTPVTTFPNVQSINFNGADSYLTFANQPELNPTTGVSLSFWVYLNSSYPSASSIIAGNYLAGNNKGFFFKIDPVLTTNTTSFSVGNGTLLGTASFSTSSIPVETWVLLTGTWDGTMIRIYRDGALQQSNAFSNAPDYTGTQFSAGNFSGRIDDMRLYKRALTATEVADLAAGHHTTATWNGSVDSYYENPNNWTPVAVPDFYALVDIANVGNQPALAVNESMGGLKIASGAQFNLNEFTFTLKDGGTFSNDGTLSLSNTQTFSGIANDINSGTVLINYTTSTTGLKFGNVYYNLTLNNSDGITVTLANNLTVHNELTLTSGTLDVSTNNYGIILNGNWLKTGGIFQPRSGTVTLNGANQSITGSNIFYNLTKTTSVTKTLTFQAGTTQTILNNLVLQGAGATSQFLSLRSATNGTAWSIDPQGARDISAVDVRDSININNTAISLPGKNVDSGNNTNWTFDSLAPEIVLSLVTSPTANSQQPVTGTATEEANGHSVSLVQFQLDSTGGSWTNCTADDSSFDGLIEPFTCTPPTLSDGSHTMYVRATDANSNTTASSYPAVSFVVDTLHTLTYTAGSNGTITGSATQTITTGASATAVTAVADVNYHFVNWSDSSTTNPRTDANVMGDISVTANFALNTFTLKYKNDGNGSVDGSDTQTVGYGGSGSEVKADSDTGYQFKKWSDDYDESTRKDENITANLTVTAEFEKKEYFVKYGAESGGSIDGDTTQTIKYKEDGDEVTAVADANYHFTGWSDGKTEKTRIEEDIEKDLSVKAEFAPNETSTSNQSEISDTVSSGTATTSATIPGTITPAKVDFNGETTTNWQSTYFGNDYCYEELRCGGLADPDGDGISNDEEFRLGTDPLKADSDQDGIADGLEIKEGRSPTVSSKNGFDDKIKFEDPKEKGETKKDIYLVSNVEMIPDASGVSRLKVSGKALPNRFVTIFIYSDPIILTVETDDDGNWSYVLDKDLEDGQHEVYVAVTDGTGKITEKSAPLNFIKTAEAITIISPAEAASNNRAASPVEAGYKKNLTLSIFIAIGALIIALIAIGLIRHNKTQSEQI